MTSRIQLLEISVEVVRKSIKQAHIAVYPPDGRVVLSVPHHATDEMVESHLHRHLQWIVSKQQLLQAQPDQHEKDLVTRESHYVWGKRYLLDVRQQPGRPALSIAGKRLVLTVPPGVSEHQRKQVLSSWYRQLVIRESAKLIPQWEARFGVTVSRCFAQSMKTQWGSTNTMARTIRINTALAKQPIDVLNFVIAYQVLALRMSPRSTSFALMLDQYCPGWREAKKELDNASSQIF